MIIESIDKDLSDKICAFIAQSLKTDEFEIQTLAGDASNRRYFRVIANNESWVLMSWEPFVDNDNYAFLSVLNHFSHNKVHVPNVVNKSPENGLILLEDLGDLTLERKFWETQDQIQCLPYYQMAIDELIKIHYHCSKTPNQCTAFKIEFDTEKFLWEFNYTKKHLIESFLKIQLSTSDEKKLHQIFFDISETLDQQEKFISHRDYHSRNLMIKLGKMRVIDFQDARLGPIQYDLVSLIHDSYVNLNPQMEELLLKDYVEKANPIRAQKINLDHFQEVYLTQKIQRCFKACGSFSSFFVLRNDRRYLKYINPTLKKVSQTLKEFPQYQFLQTLIESEGLSEKDFNQL